MTQTIDGTDYLDIDEAVALLGVKKATLYAYVSRGVLRSYRQKVGRRRLYVRADIEALRTIQPGSASSVDVDGEEEDRVLRDVDLPDVESWAGEH